MFVQVNPKSGMPGKQHGLGKFLAKDGKATGEEQERYQRTDVGQNEIEGDILPETNIAPENSPSHKEISSSNFQPLIFVLGRVANRGWDDCWEYPLHW